MENKKKNQQDKNNADDKKPKPTEFALRMMGDIQQYFINEKVRNFY